MFIFRVMGEKQTKMTIYYNERGLNRVGGVSANFLIFEIWQNQLHSVDLRETWKGQGKALDLNQYSVKQEINLDDVTDMDCYKHKDICVITGRQVAQSFKLKTGKISNYGVYMFQAESPKTSFLRVACIHRTDYFLAAGVVANGLMRWNLGNTKKYSKINIAEVPQYLSLTSIVVMESTKFAGLTFRTWKELLIFDFVSLTLMHRWKGFSGFQAYLDYKPKLLRLVLADERSLVVMNYGKGKMLKKFREVYYVYHVKAVPKSDFVTVACGEFVRVWDVGKDENKFVWSFQVRDGVYRHDLSTKFKQIFIFGNNYVRGVSLILPNKRQCHPLCQDCLTGFTNYACKSCKQNIKAVNSTEEGHFFCDKKNFITLLTDYKDVQWSKFTHKAYNKGMDWKRVISICSIILGIGILLSCLYTLANTLFFSKSKNPKQISEKQKKTESTDPNKQLELQQQEQMEAPPAPLNPDGLQGHHEYYKETERSMIQRGAEPDPRRTESFEKPAKSPIVEEKMEVPKKRGSLTQGMIFSNNSRSENVPQEPVESSLLIHKIEFDKNSGKKSGSRTVLPEKQSLTKGMIFGELSSPSEYNSPRKSDNGQGPDSKGMERKIVKGNLSKGMLFGNPRSGKKKMSMGIKIPRPMLAEVESEEIGEGELPCAPMMVDSHEH